MEFNATFLISAISFVLFTLIMNRIFYKPLEKIMTERQEYIDNTLLKAKFSSDKADAILNDKKNKIDETISNSKKMITDSVQSTNNKVNTIINNAKIKSRESIVQAKDDLQKQAQELNKKLDNESKLLAEFISSKVLGFDTKLEDIK